MEYSVFVKYKVNTFWLHEGKYTKWITAREKVCELLNCVDCEVCKIERKIKIDTKNGNKEITKSIVFYYQEEIGDFNLFNSHD